MIPEHDIIMVRFGMEEDGVTDRLQPPLDLADDTLSGGLREHFGFQP